MPAVLKLTGTLLPQNFKAQFTSCHPCGKVIPCFRNVPTQRCKGDRFEWPTIFVWHCVADVSLRDSSEVSGESLHTLLTLPQLGIAFHSPPVGFIRVLSLSKNALLALWWFSFKLMSGEDPMICHCFSEPANNIMISRFWWFLPETWDLVCCLP